MGGYILNRGNICPADRVHYTIDPKKLHKKVLLENNVVIVSEMEKGALLTAFQILRAYSKELPEEAHFKERLLVAKQQLPPVFFD